jgi:hypothetical protein
VGWAASRWRWKEAVRAASRRFVLAGSRGNGPWMAWEMPLEKTEVMIVSWHHHVWVVINGDGEVERAVMRKRR